MMSNYNFVTFGNNVAIINTTPHSVTIQDTDGTPITVPSSIILNAKAEEKQVSDLFVKTVFVPTEEGKEIISEIKNAFKSQIGTGTLVIVGSMIAAQAYPEDVVAMTPVPGYERVNPAEKRMRCDKFTTFA
jgi:hypothetical protein